MPLTRKFLPGGPPGYEQLRLWEATLPQHNLDLPFPEGRHGRYVKFSEQVKRLGWNNVLNQLLMNAHLAYESGRAYVFQDYEWKPDNYPWPPSQFLQWVPRTPLPALIAGPTAGGAWEPGDSAPRSISSAWFDVVCPPSERRIINTGDVKPPIYWARGDQIFDHWRALLREAPEPCIEVVPAPLTDDAWPQTFDLHLWGSGRILSLWDSFSQSPTSRLLTTSETVKSAVDRNEPLFHSKGLRDSQTASQSPYERMMAVHLRRGDYESACRHFAKYRSTFYSWNLLPFLPDKFHPMPEGLDAENERHYMTHCLPDFDTVVGKVRRSKEDYTLETDSELDVLYLLTNEQGEWLDNLQKTLRTDGWRTIVTTRDLVFDSPEQLDVNMAVDMDIARQAAVFVGNGWSSFTSNIVHRRLVDGKRHISIRFF
ncbi:hypothetical protein FISHEDRAFT_63468 [Fistulina hepatica ATCC 64428]|uniref:Uncharacterized protein n=1 Tax=Fistulina hepatica ATCC 64428 TaxID=1128425 RepID=A0A0D7AMD7_9AGAR|nr:hypothetical protein FISHEDRAFT_63468 [Fistulina hepatica ATCC 64428]